MNDVLAAPTTCFQRARRRVRQHRMLSSTWRGYDGLNRLTESKDGANVVQGSYAYDKTGNRTTAGRLVTTMGLDCTGMQPGEPCTPTEPVSMWTTENYTYAAGSHRLNYQGTTERRYDAVGNTIWIGPMPVSGPGDPPPSGGGETESASYEGTLQVADDGPPGDSAGDPARSFVYDASNRLRSLSVDGEFAVGYRYTGLGERVYRNGGTTTVHTVFDEQGRWRGDYDTSGLLIQEAVYLDGLPVGLIARVNGHDLLYYVQPDALGTPRVVIDPTRDAAVWRWDLDTDAFGNAKPNEDPDGDGIAFVFDQRFPGQQYDSATGFNYNYFRDYDPTTGRYVQSDPIGLDGGISTFSYINGNPMDSIDSYGLQSGPGVFDQINIYGLRGNGEKDYTNHFNVRFPNTITGSIALFKKRIKERVCAKRSRVTSVEGMTDKFSTVDIPEPDMSRFGDAPQSFVERNFYLGRFQLMTRTYLKIA